MISRKGFLRATVLAAAGSAAGCTRWRREKVEAGVRFRLRTVTYNVLACTGWSPGKGPKPNAAEMPRLFARALAKRKPDLITFQESPGEAVVKEIADRLGMNHAFFPSGDSWPGGVITRFEILESKNCPAVGGKRPEDLFPRHWGRAVLRAPFGELILHSAHLHPSKDDVRTREVTAMLEAMRPDLESGKPVIFQGDLNHTPDKSMYRQWTEAGLVDVFAQVGAGQSHTIPADKPSARIDYVWAYGPIARRARQCRVLFERPFRTDPDDPKSMALSDHLPVLAVFG